MDFFEDEEFLGRRHFPGLTADAVIAEIAENPLVEKYWRKNTKEIQERLVDTLMRIPSNSDCPGYIYGFRNLAEYKPNASSYEIKMGRTKRHVPQQRIFEWERDDDHQYVEIFTIRSEFNMKLEALVHLLFAYARKTLVINGKNRIEWFSFDEKVPTAAVTNLMNLVMEKVHEREPVEVNEISKQEKEQLALNQIISNHNEILRQVLESLKCAINKYVKKGHKRSIDLLKTLLDEESMEKAKGLIQKILQDDLVKEFQEKLVINIDQDTEQVEKTFSLEGKFLMKSLEKLLEVIKVMEANEKKLGIKLNYILGRVKEAIYFGFKGSEELEEIYQEFKEKQEIERQVKLIEEAERLKNIEKAKARKEEKPPHIERVEAEKVERQIVVDKVIKAANIDKFAKTYRIQKLEQAKAQAQKEQEKNTTSSLSSSQIHHSKSKLSQLYEVLKNVSVGESIINTVDGDFSIDCSKRVSHNLFILARSIKIYKEWNISFSSESFQQKSQKINLVIMGREIVNFDKLKIPKNSNNGIASVLVLDSSDQLLGLDEFLKVNADKLKTEFYEGIKRIFKEKIK